METNLSRKRSVQCGICSESKHLTPDARVTGWWAVRQKDGEFSATHLKVTGLRPGDRAACGIGHLMILCERAASGTLEKTVYPETRPKPVGLTEATALEIEMVDDIPPDPTVVPEPEAPVLAQSGSKFHAIPFLVRLVNRHLEQRRLETETTTMEAV